MKILYIILAGWMVISTIGFAWHYELAEALTNMNLKSCACCQRQIKNNELYFTNGFRKYDPVKAYHLFMYSQFVSMFLCCVMLIKEAFAKPIIKLR